MTEAEEVEAPAATTPSPPSGTTRAVPTWLFAAAGLLIALAWIVLRPAEPHGIAAVLDLVLLPAVLFAEIRILGGRSALSLGSLAVFFGLGAVFAGVTSVVLERGAGLVMDRPALHVVGPLVEATATCVPLLLVALLGNGRRALNIVDATLAGLASGLGLLVWQAALATGSLHAAPDYVSPLLAGMHGVPASAGAPPAYFAGHALAAALLGLAVGIGLRFADRAWRFVPFGVVFALVVFDHAVFDWRQRNLVLGVGAVASGPVDVLQTISLQGRLAVILLVIGLIAARSARGPRSEDPAGPTVDLREEEAPEPMAPEPMAPEVVAVPDAGDEPPAPALPAPAVSQRVVWMLVGLAVVVGAVLTVLARDRSLGVLERSWLALVVSGVGLVYSLWHLPSGRSPEPTSDLRHLLGAAAVASSGLGVICALLPSPDAVAPLHGGLVLETVLGWGANVGNLGFLFGLGGLAAPAGGHGKRRFGDRWSGFVLRRLGWTGWSAAGRSKGVAGGWSGRSARAKRRGAHAGALHVGSGREFLWFKVSARLDELFGRKTKRRRAAGGEGESDDDRAATVAFEPIYRSPVSYTEFVGATAQEAIEAAMRQVGVNLAHNSLQLVDHGSPAKPGKPGSGRPARVRVAEAEEGVQALVPPGRDSITMDTPFAVVVDVATGDEDPPDSLRVTLKASSEHRTRTRTLTCAQLTASDERARFRSNPYVLTTGEDTTLAATDYTTVPAGGMDVDDGGEVLATYRDARAAITVYDGWQQQVVGVNRRLFDIAAEHHGRLVTDLEEQLEHGAGPEADGIRRCLDRLAARLRVVDEGLRLLAKPSPGLGTDDVVFTSTALLHAAMTVEDDDVTDAAAMALATHRSMVEADPAADVAATSYRDFLVRTAQGRLWERGAYSVGDVARLLGWESFADDPGPGPG